jgi:hypothetical protein
MGPEDILNGDISGKVFVRDGNVVSRKIAGELFLVPVKGKLAHMEQLFTLTAVAEYIWDRLDGRKSLNDILNDITAHFDVEEEPAESDIREFITELMGAGLIHEGEI